MIDAMVFGGAVVVGLLVYTAIGWLVDRRINARDDQPVGEDAERSWF